MNKIVLFLLVVASAHVSFAQKRGKAKPQTTPTATTTQPTSAPSTAVAQEVKGIPVVVMGQIFKAPSETIHLSAAMGNGQYVDYGSFTFDPKGNGSFAISAVVPVADFYVLRAGTNHVNLIITSSDTIKVFGDGRDLLRNINIVGNENSQRLLEFLRMQNDLNGLRDSIQLELNKNPMSQNDLNQLYMNRYKQFEYFRDRFVQQFPNSPALIGPMQTYDPEKEFDKYSALAEQVIAAVPDGQVAQALRQNVAMYRQRAAASQLLAPGSLAPELEGPSPDGTTYKLSSLRGKVVLIDFWASWCGPCRKENPGVVALYEKYKDKGFTVFSVSLDSDKNAWMRAIESDKLIWPYHISELKRWDGMLSRAYGVNSIPFTVLIDAEGKVIEKNLRGPMLEQRLQQIFGF
jgi:thiol-disulfide isomerase/thioredoxin